MHNTVGKNKTATMFFLKKHSLVFNQQIKALITITCIVSLSFLNTFIVNAIEKYDPVQASCCLHQGQQKIVTSI